jgi:hypothetical protein
LNGGYSRDRHRQDICCCLWRSDFNY